MAGAWRRSRKLSLTGKQKHSIKSSASSFSAGVLHSINLWSGRAWGFFICSHSLGNLTSIYIHEQLQMCTYSPDLFHELQTSIGLPTKQLLHASLLLISRSHWTWPKLSSWSKSSQTCSSYSCPHLRKWHIIDPVAQDKHLRIKLGSISVISYMQIASSIVLPKCIQNMTTSYCLHSCQHGIRHHHLALDYSNNLLNNFPGYVLASPLTSVFLSFFFF